MQDIESARDAAQQQAAALQKELQASKQSAKVGLWGWGGGWEVWGVVGCLLLC